MSSTEAKPLIAIPKAWLAVEGEEAISGNGHTRWRHWNNDTSISTAISYNSYTSGSESLRARVIGLYLETHDDTVLGILVSKRIKGQWAQKQLILLNRIHHWVNIDASQMIHGEALTLTQSLLKNLYGQISKSKIKSDSARKTENKYLLGECTEIHRGLFPLLEVPLADVLSSLDFPDDEANERILLALQTANSQLLK